MKHLTKFLFAATEIAALIWVSIPFAIALYSTIKFGIPYSVSGLSDLSEKAIEAILGINVLKVLENTFEHNNGGIFGTSDKKDTEDHRDA